MIKNQKRKTSGALKKKSPDFYIYLVFSASWTKNVQKASSILETVCKPKGKANDLKQSPLGLKLVLSICSSVKTEKKVKVKVVHQQKD